MEEGRSDFKNLTGKHAGKRHLGRLWRRLEDNIRMDLEEIGALHSMEPWAAAKITFS